VVGFLPRLASSAKRLHATVVVFFLLNVVLSCGRPPHAQTAPLPPLQLVGQWGQAGTQPGQFQSPRAIVCDGAGSIYIADDGTPTQIEKFDLQGHPLLDFAASGPQNDWDIAIDPGGAIFVVDRRHEEVQIFSPEGEPFRSLFFRYRRDFRDPAGLAIDPDGNFYLSDFNSGRIVRMNPRGRTLEGWNRPVGIEGGRWMPYPVRLAQDGNLYVADMANQLVERLTSVGRYVTSWAFPFSEIEASSSEPKSAGLAISSSFVAASDAQKRLLEIWTLEGAPKLTIDFSQHPEWGSHATPTDIAFAPKGDLLVLDGPDSRVLHFKVNISP
jgi:DNA-binding beta-propeller fold protein YncE